MLSKDEKATNHDTWCHIHKVQKYMFMCTNDLIERAHKHDQSKLETPEVELFAEYTHQLSEMTYGSQEYNETLEKLKPALQHHYSNNRHHPEFHKNGIDDMTLVDLLEMLCDWKAASERHNNGNIRKSIEINANRFGMSPQLVKIFENTVENYF